MRFNPSFDGETISLIGLITEQLTVPSVANGLFIDASSLPNGLTLDANAEDSDNRRVMRDPDRGHRCHSRANLYRWKCVRNGGGIFSMDGDGNSVSLSLSSCTISENSATRGGGIAIDGRVPTKPFFLSTPAPSQEIPQMHRGGGIALYCTMAGNFNGEAFTFLRFFCTVSGNSANTGLARGGGVLNRAGLSGSARLILNNSILAGNSSPNGPDSNEFRGNGTIRTIALGSNLLSSLEGQTSLTETPDLIVADPFLAPLANNGGPTRTHLPKVGSPVIDAGGNRDPGGIDQRGEPRFMGVNLDIGAVEFQGRFSEFNADGDGDGASNGLEQAIGSDLFVADPENPANLFLDPESARTTPALRYRVDLSRQDDIILSLKRSFDLIDFDTTIFSNESFRFENESARIFDREAPSSGAFYRLEARPRPRP